jgi:hypothetical protein
MAGSRTDSLPQASTRELFDELVAEAGSELGRQPSRLVSGYLVDLLDARVRTPRPTSAARQLPETLAESLVEALLADGSARIARLQALGDRALFDAGFFGESLSRKTVGVAYYSDIGTTAYSRLSRGTGSELFYELASRFGDFVDLLAGVGERARGARSVDLLRLYDRYQETGSPRDRSRLVRHGMLLAPPGTKARPQ